MDDGKRAFIPKRRTHVGRAVGAVTPHDETLVYPLLDLSYDLHRLVGIDGGPAVLVDGHNTKIPEHPGKVIGIPAGHPQRITLGGAVIVLDCGLAQEGVHFIPGRGEGDAFLFGDGLIVEHADTRNGPRQAILAALVGVCIAHVHTGEISTVLFDILIKVLHHAVSSQIFNLGGVYGEHAG